MKKILISFLFVLILASCTQNKKDAALESCADFNYKESNGYTSEQDIAAKELYKIDKEYLAAKKEESRLFLRIEEKKSELAIESKNYDLEDSLPLKKMYPEFPKFINDGDFTNDNDVKKFKSDIAKHKKTKKKIDNDHVRAVQRWKEKKDRTLYYLTSSIDLLTKAKRIEWIEAIKIEIKYRDMIFLKKSLKEKSQSNLYISRYTECENSYNSTPNSFLLKWQNKAGAAG